MCVLQEHQCKRCKVYYDCDKPNRECETLNSDDDANLCETCQARIADMVQRFWDETDYQEN